MRGGPLNCSAMEKDAPFDIWRHTLCGSRGVRLKGGGFDWEWAVERKDLGDEDDDVGVSLRVNASIDK